MDFKKFDKIPRLSRDCVITEKIDGTNAQLVIISESDLLRECADWTKEESDQRYSEFLNTHVLGIQIAKDTRRYIFAGSRNRWLNEKRDNHGFAKWVQANALELFKLGEGRHYGEWYGNGIQRGYDLEEKRFALFNIRRWANHEEPLEVEDKRNYPPKCCQVVPILYKGLFDSLVIEGVVEDLRQTGSKIVSGFMKPEGIVIYHKAAGKLFKKTLENDEKPKGQ